MHIILGSLAYWSAVISVVSLIIFIFFIEFYNLAKGAEITIGTPGWRGMVPSYLLVGFCLSSLLSTLTTVLGTWI